MSEDKPVYEVFIGCLPYSVTEEELNEMFSECGRVVRVFIAPAEKFENPESSKYTYGFVGYTDEYGVKKAVNWFNGKMLHGRRIRVEETLKTAVSTGKQPASTSSRARSKNEECTYIRKCFDDVAQAKPELKLPAWSDYQKKIQSQTYSFSPLVFTFPVEDVSLDLTEVDELVKQISSTPTHRKA